ncbi:MAG: DUF5615 family PIN-like protein [Myxococcales bacterium]|nr:DUF5615 family PIN-like protein [Myxococcales bacterium]
MSLPRLYLDEDVSTAVAVAMERRGFDVLTTLAAGRRGTLDEEQLDFAASEARTLITFNRGDFARLHQLILGEGGHHAGIVVSRQAPVGPFVKALLRLFATHDAAALRDRLFWLRLAKSPD